MPAAPCGYVCCEEAALICLSAITITNQEKPTQCLRLSLDGWWTRLAAADEGRGSDGVNLSPSGPWVETSNSCGEMGNRPSLVHVRTVRH